MKKIYRGAVLNPISEKKCDFFEDGAVLLNDKVVVEVGNFSDLNSKYGKDCEVFETHALILPPFTDIHLHWVQNKVKGSFGGDLLPWLQKHIWPEEAKFKDLEYTHKMIDLFYDELLKNGTKNAMIYSSVHKDATEIAIEKGFEKGNFVTGNVLMDQNSPDYLQISTSKEVEIVEYFAKKYGPKYVVTPRFAPTCTFELMKQVSEIAKTSDCFIQTHLSENMDEIAWVSQLFPEQKSYTEVYEKAGILGEKTILGHCIHLSEKEWEILAKSGSSVAHCPTSNIKLQSGTMPIEKLWEYKIPYALGTDVGAGPKLSMIDVMRAYLEVHGDKVTAVDALYRATLAGAKIMQIKEQTDILIATGVEVKKTAEETIKEFINSYKKNKLKLRFS